MPNRKYVDCREVPSEKNCSLRISGTESEVLKAAADHMISAHDEKNTPKLRETIKKILKDETDSTVPFPSSKASKQSGRAAERDH